MAKRILVMSASVGGGHVRAAQAVELALKQLDPAATVENVDVLRLTNATFRRAYAESYFDFVNKAPHLVGYFYDVMDRPTSRRRVRDKLRLLVEKLNLSNFRKLLEKEPWDLVLNTHFLPAEIIASLRQRGKLRTPQFIVTTDYETHRLWVNQPCEHYFTATDEGAAYLEYWGVPAKDITATGIPIHPVFSQPKDRAACLKRQGLVGDWPIILQLAGGFGVGPIEQIYRGLLAIEIPLEVVVVTGRNEEARKQLEGIEVPTRHRAKVLGFTTEIDELMAVADLVVSKPGGLTTSEALASGAAMAVVNPIPGQESRNSDFLLENGAAVKINNIVVLARKLAGLLREPERIQQLKRNALRLGRPRAAFDIARMALDW